MDVHFTSKVTISRHFFLLIMLPVHIYKLIERPVDIALNGSSRPERTNSLAICIFMIYSFSGPHSKSVLYRISAAVQTMQHKSQVIDMHDYNSDQKMQYLILDLDIAS